MRENTFNRLLAILIATVTLVATVIAFLQSDASNHDDAAGRDATRLAVELVERKVSGEVRANFDYDEVFQQYVELSTLLIAADSRGDAAAVERYAAAMDAVSALSSIMQPPYYDAETGTVDYALYITESYLTEVTRMTENYTAAAAVKEAWGAKANLYIVHLTILAVALFLLGLAATLNAGGPRFIFVTAGTLLAAGAAVWAAATYTEPVFDLRDRPEVIAAYAEGTSLALRERYEEAIAAFDTALAGVPGYAAACAGRGDAYGSLGNYAAAIADLQCARDRGLTTTAVLNNQAWYQYLAGQFADSAATARAAIVANPADAWVGFNAGLALLANGQADAALAEYEQAMAAASAAVAAARRAGTEPSSFLWFGLDSAATDLDFLMATIDSGAGEPPPASIVDPDLVLQIGPDLSTRLKSLSVSLEYFGAPPAAPLTATLDNLIFAEPLYDEALNFLDYNITDEAVYTGGISEISALFDYSGMQDGQTVIIKVYIDGSEDPSWRRVFVWDAGADGGYELPLAVAYSKTFTLAIGDYAVEFYVDGQLALTGSFSVVEP